MKITIADMTFPSKQAAKDYCREIIKSVKNGDVISGTADSFLRGLIQYHPESSSKIGTGIDYFSTATDTQWGHSRHLLICRTDGTQTDVSFHSCLNKPNDRIHYIQALRDAISIQILTFKTKSFSDCTTLSCPYKNIPMSILDCHIHHEPPEFRKLVEGWLCKIGMRLEEIKITEHRDLQYTTRMTCGMQIKSWTDYHKQHANLRVISQSAHTELSKHGRDI